MDWETLNTSKIKTIFYSRNYVDNDYGTKLRIKCHQRIQRKEKSIDGELCTNWDRIDSFGVELNFDDSINQSSSSKPSSQPVDYENFYDDPIGYW